MSLSIDEGLRRFARARLYRNNWESHWRECYDFTLPDRQVFSGQTPGTRRHSLLFDGTAPDAVEQLAASILANLTPPWARWWAYRLAGDVDGHESTRLGDRMQGRTEKITANIDRSNFAVEVDQNYLDLIAAGTASLLFEEETSPTARTAFRFTAIPLNQVVLDEGPSGRLDATWRQHSMTEEQARARFGKGFPGHWFGASPAESERRAVVVEMVVPDGVARYDYVAVALSRDDALLSAGADTATSQALGKGDRVEMARARLLDMSPYINFRWSKAPGERYGRSPVMKALPDIKTVNKTVELVLKNAAMHVSGIWSMEDDGVISPDSIQLVPGAIIPRRVGSDGLRPITPSGRFEIAEYILGEVRARIRHSLLVDKLAQIQNPRMTATEVLERAAEMARLLGAVFGRLSAELLVPLLTRAELILERRGDIQALDPRDGVEVDYLFLGPLARQQHMAEFQNATMWLQTAKAMGGEAAMVPNDRAAARWLARTLGVSEGLIDDDDQVDAKMQAVQAQAMAAALAEGGAGAGDETAGAVGGGLLGGGQL